MKEEVFKVALETGLHARPAGILVKAAGAFKSRIELSAHGRTAPAKSIVGIMGLGAEKGNEVTVKAEGPDEEQAVKAMGAYLTGEKQ